MSLAWAFGWDTTAYRFVGHEPRMALAEERTCALVCSWSVFGAVVNLVTGGEAES